jgi:conjugal transfer mating pair stabilization protein TraG
VALLIGHADGETLRKFTPAESQGAKQAGYDILADAFGSHRAGPGINPFRNADIETGASSFGSVRGAVETKNLRDPSGQVSGLRDEMRSHGPMVDRQYDPSAGDRFYDASSSSVSSRHHEQQERVRAKKRDHIGAMIDQRAILPRPKAQVAHNEIGGLFVQMSESGALLRAGTGGAVDQAAAAAAAFGSTLAGGGGLSAAVTAGKEAAGSEAGWTQAREKMIGARMQQIARYGLTDAQQNLFRESTESWFTFVPSDAQRAARQAVIQEAGGGERGLHIADLIERSAATRDDTELRLIGGYNSQGQEPEKKSELGEWSSSGSVTSDPVGAAAMVSTARRLGLEPIEFVAMMSWESAGTLDPNRLGGDGGAYRGLIQFSPQNQRLYGITPGQSIAEQMPAVERYLLDRGFIPGQHTIEHAYSAVLAGNASERYWDRQDSNGTSVRNAAERFRRGTHAERAEQFLRDSLS